MKPLTSPKPASITATDAILAEKLQRSSITSWLSCSEPGSWKVTTTPTWHSTVQESYNSPLERTPRQSRSPRSPTIKGFPLWPVGKGCSGCVPVRCVETTLETMLIS